MKISIVSPVYKAEKIIPVLVDRIEKSVLQLTNDFEIILVEDCGPDNSWEVIQKIAAVNPKVIGIKLSRNFGQHHAITAGLDHANGEWIVVMDCDLQDQPEEIPNLFSKATEGFDVVFARRKIRQDNFLKRITSTIFYSLFTYLSDVEQDGTISNFGIFNHKVIDSLKQFREPLRAFTPMVKWVGFNKTSIDVKHSKRFEGDSSYNWGKLFKLAFDIALGYSDKPLKLVIKLGFIITLISVLFVFYNFYAYYVGIISQSGFSSLIISIWFLSGVIVFTLGIIGLYISKLFEGIKNRPLYIVDKKINV